jgi:hypothetical protein
MTLAEKLNLIKQSELYKLAYNGKVLGLRVKIFNSETEKFNYYDFELDLIKSKELVDFVKGLHGMKSIALKKQNDLLLSGAEINNNVVIQEFKDSGVAEDVLFKLKLIYDSKNKSVFEYKVKDHTEDTDWTRVYYTIEIADEKFVDVMCIPETDHIYTYVMDTGDGGEVYDSDNNSFEDFEYDENKCLQLAEDEYVKDYPDWQRKVVE